MIFKDRIEVYNPGLFPEGVNPEDFFSGHEHSILRNPLIAETMYKSKDIERWGSGIKRIHDECVAAGVRVDFKRLKTGFVVAFYRPKWEDGEGLKDGGQTGGQRGIILNDKQKRIIEIIKVNPKVTRKELAEVIGINTSAIQKHLSTLKNAGYIRRIGPDFGGHWKVV